MSKGELSPEPTDRNIRRRELWVTWLFVVMGVLMLGAPFVWMKTTSSAGKVLAVGSPIVVGMLVWALARGLPKNPPK